MYLRKDNIKASNRLGGDPAPGIKKVLCVKYIYDDSILTKNFNEGALVKF
jgi:hypothetical protein